MTLHTVGVSNLPSNFRSAAGMDGYGMGYLGGPRRAGGLSRLPHSQVKNLTYDHILFIILGLSAASAGQRMKVRLPSVAEEDENMFNLAMALFWLAAGVAIIFWQRTHPESAAFYIGGTRISVGWPLFALVFYNLARLYGIRSAARRRG